MNIHLIVLLIYFTSGKYQRTRREVDFVMPHNHKGFQTVVCLSNHNYCCRWYRLCVLSGFHGCAVNCYLALSMRIFQSESSFRILKTLVILRTLSVTSLYVFEEYVCLKKTSTTSSSTWTNLWYSNVTLINLGLLSRSFLRFSQLFLDRFPGTEKSLE